MKKMRNDINSNKQNVIKKDIESSAKEFLTVEIFSTDNTTLKERYSEILKKKILN